VGTNAAVNWLAGLSARPTCSSAEMLHYFAVCREGDDAAQLANYWTLDVAVDEASSVGTIEGAWMMTVRVVVAARPDCSAATY
jgi:hypothetical protein